MTESPVNLYQIIKPMAKSNETIEECLKSIDRRLIENKDEHKEILRALRETADKKADKIELDQHKSSDSKDRNLFELRVDRSWNEIVEAKEKDEVFKKELSAELAEIKKLQAIKMSNLSYVMLAIGIGVSEKVSKSFIFFHPHNHLPLVFLQYSILELTVHFLQVFL